MAKLSQLTAAVDTDTGDEIYLVQNGQSRRAQLGNIAASIDLNLPVVSVLDYIPEQLHAGIFDDTNSTDLALYIASAWTAVTNEDPLPALVFPRGVYLASSFPNFAVENAVVRSEGQVRLRYSGTSHAVFIDGGTGAAGINNIQFGPFIIECPKTGQDGLRLRNIHRSRIIQPNVRGAGWTAGVPAFAGIRLLGCVCTHLDTPIVSTNVDGGSWYNSATPLYGLYLDQLGASAQTSYCLIVDPLMEGPAYGIYHAHALGNLTIGGTCELCTHTGIYFEATNSANNRAFGVDLESNTTQDVYLSGLRNEVMHCDTAALVKIDGSAFRPYLIGGTHHQITVVAGVNDAHIGPLGFNRSGTTGAITDGGTNTQVRDAYNLGTGAYSGKPAILTGTTLAVVSGGTGDSGTAWSTSTPTPTSAGGAFTTASSILHVKTIGKTVFVGGSITITTVGGAASGVLRLTVPDTAGVSMSLTAINANTVAPAGAFINSGTTTLTINPTAGFSNGDVYYFGGVYERT